MNYKDNCLDKETFQWESMANLSAKHEQLQKESAFVFVRKVEMENGITLPFTFVGTGHLTNPRKNATTNGESPYCLPSSGNRGPQRWWPAIPAVRMLMRMPGMEQSVSLHERRVAPVVKMSSIRRTCLPERG